MEVPYVSKEVSNVVQLGLVMIVMEMVEGEQVDLGVQYVSDVVTIEVIYEHLKGHLKLRQSGRSEILIMVAADM